MSIKQGDKVKYVGNGVTKYTNQILTVRSVLEKGVILEFPQQDKKQVELEGAGVWTMDSLVCGFNEVEEQK